MDYKRKLSFRRVVKIGAFIFFGCIGGAVLYFYPRLEVATGYAAKKTCTCIFATGRNLEEVIANDLYFSILNLIRHDVSSEAKTVTSSFRGISPKTAIFRPGLGCILLDGADNHHVFYPEVKQEANTNNDAFKAQLMWTKGTNAQKLQQAVDHAFDPEGQLTHKRTSAVVVIHRDTLLIEKYAGPFKAESPQLAWSMTKSLMNAWIGILVQEGACRRNDSNLFPGWTQDGRKNITLEQLLQMNSGLEWEENYSTVCDATRMLYKSEDVSAIALSKPLQFCPGTFWYYSSGTSNLISKYIRNKMNNDKEYLGYLKIHLFDKLGMTSAFVEPDETGTLIGSSYGYATPRDWAKFGLLYLHDGLWNGNRILPEGWVTFSSTAAAGSNGKYGAQFWLNKNGIQYPDAPHDLLIADGYQGQFVFIVPSHEAVIVRMGTGGEYFDPNTFLKEILEALPAKK